MAMSCSLRILFLNCKSLLFSFFNANNLHYFINYYAKKTLEQSKLTELKPNCLRFLLVKTGLAFNEVITRNKHSR